jgi:collagenase-like PrtC family protease
VVATGVSAVRLDLHTETAASVARLVTAYRRGIADAMSGRTAAEPLVSPSTSGHFFRALT